MRAKQNWEIARWHQVLGCCRSQQVSHLRWRVRHDTCQSLPLFSCICQRGVGPSCSPWPPLLCF